MKEKIFDFIDKHKLIIFLIIITLISLYIRIITLNFESSDYKIFLKPWFDELKQNGGLKALKLDIGNYNAPYMTILALLTYLPVKSIYSIKAVSIFFDYVCAFAVMKIVKIILKNNKNKDFVAIVFYGLTLMLPTVLLNSACWGQADSIYTAFVLLSISYLLEEKYIRAFIFLGISFAFKLQFMFILPLYILIYISNKKISILHFLIIPSMNAILCLPAILFGKSILSCVNVYINQTSTYTDKISMNFPGIYNLIFHTTDKNFVMTPNEYVGKVGILITIFVFIMIAFFVLYKKIKFNKQAIIEFGFWSVMIATFLLPNMHDRYLFMGDILSLIYYIYNRDKIYIPIGIQLISLYSYNYYLFGTRDIPIQILSFIYLVLIIVVTKDIYTKYFKENTSHKYDNKSLN